MDDKYGPCEYCGRECIEPHEFPCEECGYVECVCPVDVKSD